MLTLGNLFRIFSNDQPEYEKVAPFTWLESAPKDVDEEHWLKLYHEITTPTHKTKHSAGADFHCPYTFTLAPGEQQLIPTGIKAYMPENVALFLYPRSGLGFKYFVRLANTVGVVDKDYYNNTDNEGHIFIKIRNEGEKSVTFEKGSAFAQGIFTPYIAAKNAVSNSRRTGGMGSTDKKKGK